MKHNKILALVLCLLMMIPLAGKAGPEPVPVALGETITTDFVEFSVSGKEIRPSVIGSANAGRIFEPSEKSQYFCLTGTISNLGLEGFSVKDIRFDFKFNDKYSYSGEGLVELEGWLKTDLDPLYEGKLWAVATIPNKLVDIMETCTVTISFNEGIRKAPVSAEEADYIYVLTIGKEDTEAAKDGPEITATYFEECPALPDPTSLVSLRQSGHSSSSVNGKQTKNEYRYSPTFSKDDGKALFEKYLDLLPDYGCTVNKSGDTYQILINGTQVADITYDSKQMTINMKPGNELMKPATGQGSRTETEVSETLPRIALGGKITTSFCDMAVEKAMKAVKLFSDGKGKNSRYHYYEAQSGNKLVALYGTFRNKTGEPVDIRNIYCLIEIDGKFSYRGDVYAIKKDGTDFFNDVSPMEDVKYYAYAEIPDNVLNGMTSCVVRLGFTQDFAIKFVSNGGLPDFSKCDEIYEVSLSPGDF